MAKKAMTFYSYQKSAIKTDALGNFKESVENSLQNLHEEVGALSRWWMQSSKSNSTTKTIFHLKAPNKIGDILWYLASLTDRIGANLSDVAAENLIKSKKRWSKRIIRKFFFDADHPLEEQLPRKFLIRFTLRNDGKVNIHARCGNEIKWIQLLDPIDDNAHEDDDYKFHDVFHIANATFLGWSPVLRRAFKRKRKSKPNIDRIEDGARAANLEEALMAYIFEYAKTNNYFHNVNVVDFRLLKTAERLTLNLEVKQVPPQWWVESILKGYEVFRDLKKNKGGYVAASLESRQLTYSKYEPKK